MPREEPGLGIGRRELAHRLGPVGAGRHQDGEPRLGHAGRKLAFSKQRGSSAALRFSMHALTIRIDHDEAHKSANGPTPDLFNSA
jgi:hypothetical protein